MDKIGIDWSQSSTKRGAIWIGVFVLGIIGWWLGKDIQPLLALGAGVAGGLGVLLKD